MPSAMKVGISIQIAACAPQPCTSQATSNGPIAMRVRIRLELSMHVHKDLRAQNSSLMENVSKFVPPCVPAALILEAYPLWRTRGVRGVVDARRTPCQARHTS